MVRQVNSAGYARAVIDDDVGPLGLLGGRDAGGGGGEVEPAGAARGVPRRAPVRRPPADPRRPAGGAHRPAGHARRGRHPRPGALPGPRGSGSATSTGSPRRGWTSTRRWSRSWSGATATSPRTASRPLELRHRDCGAPVHLALACATGHELAGAREVRPVLPPRPAGPPDRRRFRRAEAGAAQDRRWASASAVKRP